MKELKHILLIGNSITYHGPLAEVGWMHDWGMAASCAEKDYLHLLRCRLAKEWPRAELMHFSGVGFELHWHERGLRDVGFLIELARQWKPDLVILNIGENVDDSLAAEKDFGAVYTRLIEALCAPARARVICAGSFWPKQAVNAQIEQVAREQGCLFVDLSPLGSQPENMALGLFENPDVAKHPGDKGMARIGDAMWEAICSLM